MGRWHWHPVALEIVIGLVAGAGLLGSAIVDSTLINYIILIIYLLK